MNGRKTLKKAYRDETDIFKTQKTSLNSQKQLWKIFTPILTKSVDYTQHYVRIRHLLEI